MAPSSDEDNSPSPSRVISPTTQATTQLSSSAVFRDNQHWHNNKKILAPSLEKKVVCGGPPNDDDPAWLKEKKDRKQQKFTAAIHWHAATPTGAKGTQLQKIVIPATRRLVAAVLEAEVAKPVSTKPVKKAPGAHKATSSVSEVGKKDGKQPKLSSADRLRAQIQADKTTKTASESEIWWKQQLAQLGKFSNAEQKTMFLDQLARNKAMNEGWLRVESACYRVQLELSSWTYDPKPEATMGKYAFNILRLLDSIHNALDLYSTMPPRSFG